MLVAWLSTTLAFELAAAICRGALPDSAHLFQQQPVVDLFYTRLYATRVHCPKAMGGMGADP